MQAKVEEVVRKVVIPFINDNIDVIVEEYATKENLEKTILESGSILSVFGRTGRVVAKEGDYTAEQVGAAAKKHAEQHKKGGTDPLDAKSIGAQMPIKKVNIVLKADSWANQAVHKQIVEVEGVTPFSKIDFQPDNVIISQMIADGTTALFASNDNGVISVFAIDGVPTADLTIQATVTEVE